MHIKILIIIMLLGIFSALGHGLYSLTRQKELAGLSEEAKILLQQKTVRALTWRIGLSMGLFLLLLLGFYFGLIPADGSYR